MILILPDLLHRTGDASKAEVNVDIATNRSRLILAARL